MAQANMPPPAWAPPQAWSQPGPPPGFAAPNYAPAPPPPPPLPQIVAPPLSAIGMPPAPEVTVAPEPAVEEIEIAPAPEVEVAAPTAPASLGEVPEQLLRVLEVVTNMCDHVIEYIEADRVERRLMVEALTKLAKAMGEALPPPTTPIVNTERLIGGSMEAGPDPVVDVREPDTAVQVKCRFGDKWVDGFEIVEVLRDEDDDVVYRLRRRIDGVVLPEPFVAADIRHVETLEDLTETPQQQKYWTAL